LEFSVIPAKVNINLVPASATDADSNVEKVSQGLKPKILSRSFRPG
jgi:hypothetical protein